jgi:hypothetical protein
MLIIGVDFHWRFQQIAMVDTETGELIERRLEHGNGGDFLFSVPDAYFVNAKILTGAPEPPSSLLGATTTVAPNSGACARFATFSSWYKL